jgi:hypothetical protein
MTDKPKMTPEQEAKLAKALVMAKNLADRMERIELLFAELLADQDNHIDNCSDSSSNRLKSDEESQSQNDRLNQ